MKTTVIGAYPKIGDGPEAQELRRALHRHDRGEISDPELGKVFDDVTRTAIGEIEAAGVGPTNARPSRGGRGAAGATMIDIDDPAVAAWPKHIELAREAYRRLADPDLALTLVTYFFPADSILESLASFPVAAVAIDVRSRETTAFDRLDAFRTQLVLLGVVDARNTRLESADEVARYAERALKLVPQERLVLATTTSLEYLPRDVARAKLTALVEGARLVTGEKVPA